MKILTFIFFLTHLAIVASGSELSAPSLSEKSLLKGQLVRAQFHFLKGSLNQAKKKFTEISDRRFEKSWGQQDRQHVVYSLLRLAQLEKDSAKKAQWLTKAWQFDNSVEPNHQLFPPPLVKRWQSIAKEYPLTNFLLPSGFEHYDSIMINGKSLPVAKGVVKTTPGEKYVELTSNEYENVHITMDIKKLENYKLPLNKKVVEDQNTFFAKQISRPHDSTPKNNRPSFWRRNRTALIVGAVLLTAAGAWHASESSKGNGSSSNQQIQYTPQSHTMSNRSQ